jgi:hypothetical protein
MHLKFVPPGQIVTGRFCVQVLQRLRGAVCRKRRDEWQGQWFLHHDNAPSRASLVVQQFIAEKNIPVITRHRTLWISLRVTFGCSKLWKWASSGYVSQPWRTSNRMRRPSSGRIQMKPPSGATNSAKIDGASVRACRVPLWRWLWKRCRISYRYSAVQPFPELLTVHCVFFNIREQLR